MAESSKTRTLVLECLETVGRKVNLEGWVQVVRAHGKIAFIDLKDRTGIIQVGAFKPELALEFSKLRSQDVVSMTGTVKERGERYINKNIPTGTIEIEAESLEVISRASEMPFDMGGRDLNLELPTLLDNRFLTLKHEKVASIFRVQERIVEEFRKVAKSLGCIEVFPPAIAPAASEGGADVFKIDYYDHTAYLAQSPQLYKQILVGAFERVYMVTHAYRAEPSVTTRHLSELVQLDIEMAFVTFQELLDALELVGTTMLLEAGKQSSSEMAMHESAIPKVPNKIPRVTLREAQEIIGKRRGKTPSKESDLNPEDEKDISDWAMEEHESDFVTVTHFPTSKKPFYTMPDPQDKEYSLSYDLIFRGTEISSGSQRINDYEMLLEAIKKRKIDPEKLGLYLEAFKYGMPPEGGFSFGIERLTMKLLNLQNVREASLFPRDMERVDERFSKTEKDKEK